MFSDCFHHHYPSILALVRHHMSTISNYLLLYSSHASIGGESLLHLLSQRRVLHTGSQHGEEEGGAEGAQAESHPGDGVGQHHLLPLSVHRLQNLIGQDGRAHTMGQLPHNNCGGSHTTCTKKDRSNMIPPVIHISSLLPYLRFN